MSSLGRQTLSYLSATSCFKTYCRALTQDCVIVNSPRHTTIWTILLSGGRLNRWPRMGIWVSERLLYLQLGEAKGSFLKDCFLWIIFLQSKCCHRLGRTHGCPALRAQETGYQSRGRLVDGSHYSLTAPLIFYLLLGHFKGKCLPFKYLPPPPRSGERRVNCVSLRKAFGLDYQPS